MRESLPHGTTSSCVHLHVEVLSGLHATSTEWGWAETTQAEQVFQYQQEDRTDPRSPDFEMLCFSQVVRKSAVTVVQQFSFNT